MSDIMKFPDLGATLSKQIVGAAIEVHKHLGPGLLESIYEQCLEIELKRLGVGFERQKKIPVIYKGQAIGEGFRADFIVENKIIIELKAVEKIIPLHEAQLLSYMKLSKIPLGLIMNFNAVLLKDGIKRMALSQNVTD